MTTRTPHDSAGYFSGQYVASFSAFGTPVELPTAGGWLLKRAIPGSDLHDAMGCYPVFCCRHWDRLGADIARLRDELVSVVVVTDPLADVDEQTLRRNFGFVRPYKDNYVVQAGRPPAAFVSKSHREQVRRALRKVSVAICANPVDYLDEWERLFSVLADRHAITGMRRFSRAAFAQQLATPGMVMFSASAGGRIVGLDLWYVQDGVAQGHLAAFDETGYRLRASYATKWTLLEYFSDHDRKDLAHKDKVAWINLGAGTRVDGSDGLSYFKKGFSTGTRRSWLCGTVLQTDNYATLCRKGAAATAAHGEYFPAYRDQEFARTAIDPPAATTATTPILTATASAAVPAAVPGTVPDAQPGRGYLSPDYAAAFAGFGTPFAMPQSGGWALRRRIPGASLDDAMGLYPLFCCADWRALGADLAALDPGIVSVTLAPDPFGNYTPALLNDTFDVVREHKERYIVELSRPPEQFITTHHRKAAMKGLAQLEIEHCARPMDHLDEWVSLYMQICRRHNVTDIRAFSPESFRRQLQVPGLEMFRARHEGRTVAIHLWMTHGNVAYGHLAGHDDAAYRLNASYALYWHALAWFWTRVEFIDLGATAGAGGQANDGLSLFKKGWSTGTRIGYICGRILQPAAYAALTRERHPQPTTFFPAYRAPLATPGHAGPQDPQERS